MEKIASDERDVGVVHLMRRLAYHDKQHLRILSHLAEEAEAAEFLPTWLGAKSELEMKELLLRDFHGNRAKMSSTPLAMQPMARGGPIIRPPDEGAGKLMAAAFVPAMLLLAGCAGSGDPPSAIPAAGRVAGRPFAARVDSDIARYYLEDFPAAHPQGWHDELRQLLEDLPDGLVPQASLAEISRRQGSPDLAALLFMDKVFALEKNRDFARCLDAMTRALEMEEPSVQSGFAQGAAGFKILLAPGWLYESNPDTEADFARTRRTLDRIGVPYRFIPLSEDGTVEENARMLADAIRDEPDKGALILVSASKSASEAALVLGRLLRPEETRAVAAWINAGGVIHGTPLADHWTRFPRNLAARIAFLYMGWRYASLVDLRTDRSTARMAGLELPEHILVVNYVAVPMGSQVSPGARDRHRLLSRFGPNDGLAPLAYTAIADAITILEAGADHYFLTVDIDVRTVALTRAVQQYLSGRPCP